MDEVVCGKGRGRSPPLPRAGLVGVACEPPTLSNANVFLLHSISSCTYFLGHRVLCLLKPSVYPKLALYLEFSFKPYLKKNNLEKMLHPFVVAPPLSSWGQVVKRFQQFPVKLLAVGKCWTVFFSPATIQKQTISKLEVDAGELPTQMADLAPLGSRRGLDPSRSGVWEASVGPYLQPE